MNVVPFQAWKWVYRRSNKDMHNSFSVVLGKLESRRLNCRLLLKCYYQYLVSLFFFMSCIVIYPPLLSVS